MIILPEFYETHLKRELGRTEYLLLKLLINLLQSIKTVSIESLATALPLPILFESRRKRIQRFLSLNYINRLLFFTRTYVQIKKRKHYS